MKPDIVLLNGLTNLMYAPFLTRAGIVLFAREIVHQSFPDKPVVTLLINRFVDHVICITEHERDALSGVQAPLTVIYNPHDREIASQSCDRGRSQAGTVRIGLLGQICEPKGQFLLFEAMTSYKKAFEDAGIRFVIFGNNLPDMRKNQAELSQRSQQLDCEHLVTFPGWVDDSHEALHGLDMVLRTDLTGSPWGRDVIEAMSHGLPVIASGYSEVFVKHGQTGRLFPPGDVHAMAQHILDLASDLRERERYATRALEFANTHFGPSQYAARVASILDSVARDRSH